MSEEPRGAQLAALQSYHGALSRIAAQEPWLETASKLTGSPERLRCQHCGHAWRQTEHAHHAPNCAYIAAKDALSAGSNAIVAASAGEVESEIGGADIGAAVSTTSVPTEDPAEHPAARRMRERFEAKYGDLSDVMRAANAWRSAWASWQRPYNREMSEPVSEDDVDAAERAMLDAVCAAVTRAAAGPESTLVEPPAEVRAAMHRALLRSVTVLPDAQESELARMRKLYKLVPVDEAPPENCDRKGCNNCCSDPCSWVEEVADRDASWRVFDASQDSHAAQSALNESGDQDGQ